MIDRRLLLSALAVLAANTAAPSAIAANPPAPAARDAALADGCQRSDLGIVFDNSPEWVYVYKNPATRMAHGVVRVTRVSVQDPILQHTSYDFGGNLVVDPPFRYLLAGSAAARTNNFAPGDGGQRSRLRFAWESATLPRFAWPTDGDRATIWGSWSWDCARWETAGGTITGEQAQLHPLSAIVVQRRNPYLAARGETQADVFISNQGNAAHAVEQCALGHQPAPNDLFPQYDAGFTPCATTAANRIQPLAGTYSFFVPAPPKPSRKAQLRYRIEDRIGRGSGSERVRRLADGLDVTVTMRGAASEVRYGKTFLVSWTKPPRVPPTALNVTLRTLIVNQADPAPALPDPSGAHWNLYLDVNGYWQVLNGWIPTLTTSVVDGKRFSINRTIRIYVPHGSGVWFQVDGRECDQPAGRVVVGIATNPVYPCPANTDELNPNILDAWRNDDPGTILDAYPSADAALGTHTSHSSARDYQLTYSVSRSSGH
jgi:hypothetical protein